MEEKELVERLVSVEQRSKSNTKQIAEVKETTNTIQALQISMKEMLSEMKYMREDNNKSNCELKKDIDGVKDDVRQINKDVGTINKEITVIKSQPSKEKAKKWDSATWIIIAGVISFVLGYFLNMIVA